MQKTLRLSPEGPTHPRLCRPSGPQIPDVRIPKAHATGIGFVDPPGLKTPNFQKRQRGISWNTALDAETQSLADAAGRDGHKCATSKLTRRVGIVEVANVPARKLVSKVTAVEQ